VPSPSLTRRSVTQTLLAHRRAEPLSSTFHRRFLRLLSGRAIIDSVTQFADATRSLDRPRRPWAPRRGHRPSALLRAPALVGLVVLSLLAASCGSPGSHVAQLASTTTQSSHSSNPQTTNSQSTNSQKMLAFSRCVREHGVPNYPDPDSSGTLPASGKQIARSSPQFPAAESACTHLLPGGAGTPQQRQAKFAFALKVARCLRTHGFPNVADPTVSNQGTGNVLPPGIDPTSPRFQAAQTTCQKQAQQALGLP
jgi:hypothetical protein